MSLIIHILIACGFLTFLHPGFANAGEVKQLRDEQRIERQTDLEQKILEVREKQCTAEGQVKTLHTFTLQKMLVEYQKLAGSTYPVPGCGDFQ